MRLSLLFLVLAINCFAAKPERIEPRTLVLHPSSWYAEQAKLWESVAYSSPSDAQAWLHYYASSRFGQQPASSLRGIVTQMAKSVPGTYEYLLVDGWNEGMTARGIDLITKAFQMEPDRPHTYGLLALYSEMNLDASQRTDFTRLYASGQVSASLLNYSYNVLMSVEQGSVLFTEGENTTLPLFVLQDVMNVRRDVIILNLDLLMEGEYLTKKFESIGLLAPVAGNDKKAICKEVPAQNAGRNFYYALTVNQGNIETIKDQLYVVGLASQLSPQRMDNISMIRENMEKKFLMDYLLVDFNGESEHATGKVLSSNYLVPMLLLYNKYKSDNNTAGMNTLGQLLRKVAQQSGKEAIVSNLLAKEEIVSIPYFPNGVDFKTMGLFKPMTKRLHANETEVTNFQYNTFLDYLQRNKLNDLYEKYKFDLSSYEEPALALMKNYSSNSTHNKWDMFYRNYPAINVSYDAALAYCEWLTDQYNRSTSKKFKKVKFRLPTKEEWIVAAAGVKDPITLVPSDITLEGKFYPDMSYEDFGKKSELKKMKLSDPDVMYPWYFIYNLRNTPRNNKDCFLGNFRMAENTETCRTLVGKISTPDGFQAMSATKSYFPNELGLYDVVGNVEEMLAERGLAAGGSWNHLPEESTIKSVHSYERPNASLGFRVFMEIIEE